MGGWLRRVGRGVGGLGGAGLRFRRGDRGRGDRRARGRRQRLPGQGLPADREEPREADRRQRLRRGVLWRPRLRVEAASRLAWRGCKSLQQDSGQRHRAGLLGELLVPRRLRLRGRAPRLGQEDVLRSHRAQPGRLLRGPPLPPREARLRPREDRRLQPVELRAARVQPAHERRRDLALLDGKGICQARWQLLGYGVGLSCVGYAIPLR
mmetsp:Transcript_131717/g.340841  ORF Transcript_131717/g.340841 Transcript_131717/m.340841 type:complete len:209 (+) Transcript_131717:710-1336(+)